MNVYQADTVRKIEVFYGQLLYQTTLFPKVKDHLAALADKLWEGIQEQRDELYMEINNYHPSYLGTSKELLKKTSLKQADCQATIAAEYGYGSWEALEKLDGLFYDQHFEQAVNTLLQGDLLALKTLLKQYPDLVQERSVYGHGATLLHYTGSNGVELWRQKVPANLSEIIRFLLDSGARREAGMKVYGGQFDTRTLLQTSAHPFEAGVADEALIALQ